MGTCLDILLVKTSLGSIPNNLNDMVCLLTIAARRVSQQGNQIEFTKLASRRHVLEEMERLLEFKRSEIEKKAEKVENKKEKALSTKNMISTLAFEAKDTPNFTVTAEELTNMNCLLKRIDEATTSSFLKKSMEILHKAEVQLEQDEFDRLQASQQPGEVNTSAPDVKRQTSIFLMSSCCVRE